MPSIAVSFVETKRRFAWFRRHTFSYLRILIDPGHPGDVFDIDYVPFERFMEAAISRGAAAGALVTIPYT